MSLEQNVLSFKQKNRPIRDQNSLDSQKTFAGDTYD